MVVQKGTVGVWNGTAVRLFKVETVAATGPSLMKVRAFGGDFPSLYFGRAWKTHFETEALGALLNLFPNYISYLQSHAD